MCISSCNSDPALRVVVTIQQMLPTTSGFFLVEKRALFFGEMLLVSKILLCDILLHPAYLILSSSDGACKRFCAYIYIYINLFLLEISTVTLSAIAAPISWHSVAVTSVLHQQPKYLHEMDGPGGSCSWRHPLPKQGTTCQSTFTMGPRSVWDGEKRCVPNSELFVHAAVSTAAFWHEREVLEDHSQCAFGWESVQMRGMRC